MALRTTFGEVVEAVRGESRLSTNTSRGIDHLDHIRQLVRRHYRTLAEDFDWQHLELKKETGATAGSRVLLQAGLGNYAFPVNVNPMKIRQVWVKWGSQWQKVDYGIKYADYNYLDPDADQRTDPITNWQFRSDIEFDVYPLPATDGVANGVNEVAFEGQKKVETLLTDANRLDLDDDLVTLLVSAEILAENGQKVAAQVKGDAAIARMQRVRGNLGGTTRYTMGMGIVGSAAHAYPRHPTFIRAR